MPGMALRLKQLVAKKNIPLQQYSFSTVATRYKYKGYLTTNGHDDYKKIVEQENMTRKYDI